MSNIETPTAKSELARRDENDLIWGGKNIAKSIGVTLAQFYYLHEIGALDGAVTKLGHKTFLGSYKKLQALPYSKKGK